MTDYGKLAAQLAKVRRAWKVRRALGGLAIVLLESLGLFTLIVLADWLYQPSPPVRTSLFILGVAAVAALVYKHMLAHVFRRIPDEQLALYVEEHRKEFQGALMTAAEFGRGRDLAPGQARMIAAVLAAATRRAEGVNLKGIASLRRFRKYAVAAAILLAVYGGLCVLFPQSVGHHASRVLAPWRLMPEDLPAGGGPGAGVQEAAKPPITFTLSKTNVRLPRGGQLDLEAVLSRAPAGPVVLHFRPSAEGAAGRWRDMPMKEIDKLNGFAAVLKDVNEDLEFQASTGEYKSDACRVAVYSPLALEAIHVSTKYPEYLKLPDAEEIGGDVSAPVGSTVTVSLATNNPLVGGNLKWEGKAAQDVKVGEPRTAAVATFEVKDDASYTYALRDVDGQELAGTVPFYVRALKDQPPMLEVKFPKMDVSAHPLGQVSVEVEAADDWGVADADLVCEIAAEGAPPPVRLPMKLAPLKGPDAPRGKAVSGAAVFALEELQPAAKPGTVITYHVEARDQKGQKAISDIYMITISPFEQWATWGMEFPEFGAHGGYLSEPLSIVLAAVWHLHSQKEVLPEADFNKQADGLAKSMVDPSSGEVFPYIKMKYVPEAKKEHGLRVIELAKKAHGELVKHDTGKAVEYLRLGMAQLALIGLSESPELLARGGGGAMGGAEPTREATLDQIAHFMLEAKAADLSAPLGQSNFEIIGPEYRRELRKIEEAERLARQAENLRNAEQGIMNRAAALAAGQQGERQAGEQPGAPQAGQQVGQQNTQPAAGDSSGALAQDQRALAEQAKAAAMDAKAAAGADHAFGKMAEKLDAAAGGMFAAAGKMREGDVQRALADVKQAQDNLVEAAKSVQGLQRHSLEQALDLAQARTEAILRDQREARTATAAIDAQGGEGGKPTAGQQRDLARLAARQGEIRAATERLKEELGALREWVQKGVRPETTRNIEEADRGIDRHQVVQKMTNAAIELGAARPKSAAAEQAKAEAGVQAVLDKLREAAGTLASDYKSELVRAKFEADRVAGELARLGGKEGGQQAGKEAGQQAGKEGGQQAGKEGGQQAGKEAGQQAGKEGGQQAGKEAGQQAGKEGGQQAGKEGGQQAGKEAGQQAGKEAGQQAGKEAGQQGGQPNGNAGTLSEAERRQLGQKAASDLANLGRHLERRRFAADEAREIKRLTENYDTLPKVLASDEAKREELLAVIRRIGGKLMAELDAKLEAERLKDFQREECPPQYRPLVNKYYELLGQSVKE